MERSQLKIGELLDLEHTEAKELFLNKEYPWEVLPEIKEFIKELSERLPKEEYIMLSEGVWSHRTATIAPTAYIAAPCIIGEGTEVRHCAFIRGSALIGKNCVIGNSTELKNVIIFDNVQVPHYNYVGDSILGYKSHMGAGSITSNVKSDKSLVKVHTGNGDIETGLKKFGAILGDRVEVGCGSILNPGSVIGRNVNIYPLSSVRKAVPSNTIYKNQNEICEKRM